jgi:hypothetical protein
VEQEPTKRVSREQLIRSVQKPGGVRVDLVDESTPRFPPLQLRCGPTHFSLWNPGFANRKKTLERFVRGYPGSYWHTWHKTEPPAGHLQHRPAVAKLKIGSQVTVERKFSGRSRMCLDDCTLP